MQVSQEGSGGGSGRRRGRRRGNEEMSLQITAMADIFTVLLVFLLKSYAVSAINVNVGKEVALPVARGGTESVEAMKVEVTMTGVYIEGNPVLKWENYEPAKGDVSAEGTLGDVVKALEKERAKQRALASVQGSENEKKPLDSKLLIIADKKVPYKTLKYVLASASTQDYTDFKLVVVTED